MADTDTGTKTPVATENVFSKADLMQSKKYKNNRDLLSAILTDDIKYTIKDVDGMIDKYMKGVI